VRQARAVDLEFVEHPQGGTKKGKPNEAMKEAAKADGRTAEGLWMPGSLRLLEDAIYERRIRFRRNPVLISAMMSAVTDEDRWGNRWLAKERAVNKIDAAVAVCMAIGAAEALEAPASRPATVINCSWFEEVSDAEPRLFVHRGEELRRRQEDRRGHRDDAVAGPAAGCGQSARRQVHPADPFLWQHRHDQPIGHVIEAAPNKSGIPFKAQLVKARGAGRADGPARRGVAVDQAAPGARGLDRLRAAEVGL
jgi:hypothetical protein